MKPFKYLAPESLTQALALFWGSEGAGAGLAGGTELLGLLKTRLVEPAMVIDLKRVKKLHGIRTNRAGSSVGALVTLAELAADARMSAHFGALAEAAGAVGTPQLRNRGTLGGNLCQRPRCLYLRSGFDCFKAGGAGCPARDGESEYLAILGAEGAPCHAVHPSDPAVALTLFDARVNLASASGRRTLELGRFFEPTGEDPRRETALRVDEILIEVRLSRPPEGTRSGYLKSKDRSAFAFALVSAAAALRVKGGVIRHARLALGGVAPAPWRARRAEQLLLGQRPSEALFRAAARAELEAARPLAGNGYKVTLASNVATQLLTRLTR